MSEQLFRDLGIAIQGGDPDRIASLLHDIRRAGSARSPERIALVEPLLHHPAWAVRHGALFVLCARWRLPHLRDVAWDLWERDPDEEVRCAALLGWASYDEHIGNPAVAETLLRIMLDPQEEDRVRACAYGSLLSVCKVPGPERPRISLKVAQRTDWSYVWRLVGGLGVDLTPYQPPVRER